MTQATVALILGLLPVAEKLVFEVGGKLIELNTENLTAEDLKKAIEESKSDTWPQLQFASPNKG